MLEFMGLLKRGNTIVFFKDKKYRFIEFLKENNIEFEQIDFKNEKQIYMNILFKLWMVRLMKQIIVIFVKSHILMKGITIGKHIKIVENI